MKLPRDLAGNDLAKHLCKYWGYSIVHQVGSHMILQTEDPSHQRMPIPAHGFLRIGTLNAILRLVANHKGVSKEEILEKI
jgi:predicted RNA binding protein YcfA (HicA-like mRNA interferase family)